jgi:oligoendopeptidase F
MVPNAAAPLTKADLDRFRDRADRFIAELDEEFYLHYGGLKEKLELSPIYERYSELTQLEQAQALGETANGDRGVRELWRFAAEGYLSELTRELAEKIADLEASLEATVDGETIPFRMLRPSMANEPDRDKRAQLDKIRVDLTEEHLNPLYSEGVGIVNDGVAKLEAPNYADLYRRFGFRLDELADQCRALLDTTEQLYEESADKLFRSRVGVGLEEAQRWDVVRTFRAPEWDPQFPPEKMMPALEATLADLGIDLKSQKNIELDVEQRPKKSPRAFCAPIEIPGRVVLVIQPMGGADDWRALFHEAGHTEHYANTSADLIMEEKRLGDVAVTEGWAMLMQHLTDDPAWLSKRLDFPRPKEFEAEGTTQLLYMVRRYSAKLLYELEFHQADDPTKLASRYVEILGDALKIDPSPADYLADMDGSFYVTGYLRSWAFEAQFRTHLKERYGSDWFTKREAGSLVRELWETGMSMTADEMLKDVTGQEIEMDSVATLTRETLR